MPVIKFWTEVFAPTKNPQSIQLKMLSLLAVEHHVGAPYFYLTIYLSIHSVVLFKHSLC